MRIRHVHLTRAQKAVHVVLEVLQQDVATGALAVVEALGVAPRLEVVAVEVVEEEVEAVASAPSVRLRLRFRSSLIARW